MVRLGGNTMAWLWFFGKTHNNTQHTRYEDAHTNYEVYVHIIYYIYMFAWKDGKSEGG